MFCKAPSQISLEGMQPSALCFLTMVAFDPCREAQDLGLPKVELSISAQACRAFGRSWYAVMSALLSVRHAYY